MHVEAFAYITVKIAWILFIICLISAVNTKWKEHEYYNHHSGHYWGDLMTGTHRSFSIKGRVYMCAFTLLWIVFFR